MKALLLTLLLSHASPPSGRRASAHFAVTCTVASRVTVGTTTIVYAAPSEHFEPRVINGTVTF